MARKQPELEPVELPPQGIHPENEVSEEGNVLLQWILEETKVYKEDLDFYINVREKTITVDGSGWDMKTWRNFLEGIYFSALAEDCPNTTMDLKLTIKWDQVINRDSECNHPCGELQGVEHED